MARRKQDFEDDGRTIADMSGISDPLHRGRPGADSGENPQPQSTWDLPPMKGKERGMFILGALKAALLIALAFLGGLALVIFILLQIWT